MFGWYPVFVTINISNATLSIFQSVTFGFGIVCFVKERVFFWGHKPQSRMRNKSVVALVLYCHICLLKIELVNPTIWMGRTSPLQSPALGATMYSCMVCTLHKSTPLKVAWELNSSLFLTCREMLLVFFLSPTEKACFFQVLKKAPKGFEVTLPVPLAVTIMWSQRVSCLSAYLLLHPSGLSSDHFHQLPLFSPDP